MKEGTTTVVFDNGADDALDVSASSEVAVPEVAVPATSSPPVVDEFSALRSDLLALCHEDAAAGDGGGDGDGDDSLLGGLFVGDEEI